MGLCLKLCFVGSLIYFVQHPGALLVVRPFAERSRLSPLILGRKPIYPLIRATKLLLSNQPPNFQSQGGTSMRAPSLQWPDVYLRLGDVARRGNRLLV